ncbi:MAG: polyprenyl synthetase family protein [Chloroflexi bacterium]|nr:polyprenyl synthetase family protein [Chloroflexota bacterium]
MATGRFPFMSTLLDHVFAKPGKRVRPAITLLASNFHDHDERITHAMATAVELLHIATLIHDDTVDDSDLRRGQATVSSLWGRNAAVLVGDYLFAASATFVCDVGDVNVIRRFAETIMELSAGELQEMSESFSPNQSMEMYLDRIYNKTASLFKTAGESGAMLSGAGEAEVKALKDYSFNLGMAFQIVDDILDFDGTEEEIGKPVGNDLVHGIITLPTLLAMRRHPQSTLISDFFRNSEDTSLLQEALSFIRDESVLEEAYQVAGEYSSKSLAALSTIPANPSRDALEELVNYVTIRRF